MSSKHSVLVVGGGFSGLVQAYYLVEAGYSVTVYDKSERLGGLLGTQQQQGFMVEQAANAFMANRELEAIADRISLPLIAKMSSAKKRYIYKQGDMRRLPVSVKQLFSVILSFTAMRWGLKSKRPQSNQTIRQWSEAIFGSEVTRYLIEPALRGIYVDWSDQLDAQLIIESMLKKYPKGRLRGSVAPQQGMGQWVSCLEAYLKQNGCEFRYDTSWVDRSSDQGIIFAVDLNSLKALASSGQVIMPDSLNNTECASLTSVTLCFDGTPPATGFGCLFPRGEGFHSSGVLFNHSIFPERAENGFSETWILSDGDMTFSAMGASAVFRYVLSDRYHLFSSGQQPLYHFVSQWPDRIPLYNRALKDFLNDWRGGLRKRDPLLVGNYLGDLGLSKILYHAKANAEKVRGGWFG